MQRTRGRRLSEDGGNVLLSSEDYALPYKLFPSSITRRFIPWVFTNQSSTESKLVTDLTIPQSLLKLATQEWVETTRRIFDLRRAKTPFCAFKPRYCRLILRVHKTARVLSLPRPLRVQFPFINSWRRIVRLAAMLYFSWQPTDGLANWPRSVVGCWELAPSDIGVILNGLAVDQFLD